MKSSLKKWNLVSHPEGIQYDYPRVSTRGLINQNQRRVACTVSMKKMVIADTENERVDLGACCTRYFIIIINNPGLFYNPINIKL